MKIKVPERMLRAVGGGANGRYDTLEAALSWLALNPIVPTEEEVIDILQKRVESGHLSNKEYCAIPVTTVQFMIRAWQSQMFLDPEPKVPEAIKDMVDELDSEGMYDADFVEKVILEAYRRGKEINEKAHL